MKKITILGFLLVSFAMHGQWEQIGADIDGEAAEDQSGFSVSLNSDGTIVAIGAQLNEGNGSNSGHVRIYQNINGTWTQIGEDIDGEAVNDRSGWSVSLNFDGSIVAIGALLNDGNGSRSGHVRIYQNINGTWAQIGEDIDGEAANDQSGMSVSLNSDGTIVAIGALLNDGNGSDSGHVRIYQNINGTWTQIGDDIDGEAANDQSGWSVSLNADGTIVAIGARLNNGNSGFENDIRGHVRIYQNINGTWTQIGDDIDGEAAGDQSGWSVSLNSDGTIVAIGAPSNEGNGTFSGHVRVYQNINGTWTQIGDDIDGEAADDDSGRSVSLNADGTMVAIAALSNDGNGSNSGHVRIYQNINGSWTQIGDDIDGEAANDQSGISVSLNFDGTKVAIGSRINEGNGSNSGHVRVYEFNEVSLSTTELSIEELAVWSINDKIYTNKKDITIQVYTVAGQAIANENLSGAYIVRFTDKEGNTQTSKILVK